MSLFEPTPTPASGLDAKSKLIRFGVATAALLTLTQGGCASLPAQPAASLAASSSDSAHETPHEAPQMTVAAQKVDSRRIAQEGVAALRRGDADKALRLFNAAIKFDSENGAYHLLAGVAYHLKYLDAGAPEMRDDAVIGYQLAARYQPLDARPKLQLGRLYADAHDNAHAKEAFAEAVSLAPENLDALRGLATASYLVGDLKTALWCAQEMETRGADPATVDRFRAVFYTALGDNHEGQRYRDLYASSQTGAAPKALDERLNHIRSMLDTRNWSVQPGASGRDLLQRVSTNAAPAPGASSGVPAVMAQAAAPQNGPAAGSPAPYPAPVSSGSKQSGDAADPWWVCRGSGPAGAAPPAREAPNSADETTPLTALPSPCFGAPPPRSVVIDAVLLRTDDEITRSYGLNVLQGLTGFFGYAANFAKAGSAAAVETQATQAGLGLSSGSAAAPLTYSLNIANATQNRTYVIARPTLMAIDRIPSTFFSGDTVSLAVGGGVAGAVSSLVDKQIGLSFSITPTFLDDNHVLLSVKVVGSYFGVPSSGTTGVALQQSRSAVNASLVASFGQTVILSGLTQRAQIRAQSGVPVLQDIPGLQYAFSQSSPIDDYESVIMMISLRRPETSVSRAEYVNAKGDAADGQPGAKPHSFDWRIQAYEKKIEASVPSLESSLAVLTTNELYKGFRSGDLMDPNWTDHSKIDVLLQEILETAVH